MGRSRDVSSVLVLVISGSGLESLIVHQSCIRAASFTTSFRPHQWAWKMDSYRSSEPSQQVLERNCMFDSLVIKIWFAGSTPTERQESRKGFRRSVRRGHPETKPPTFRARSLPVRSDKKTNIPGPTSSLRLEKK